MPARTRYIRDRLGRFSSSGGSSAPAAPPFRSAAREGSPAWHTDRLNHEDSQLYQERAGLAKKYDALITMGAPTTQSEPLWDRMESIRTRQQIISNQLVGYRRLAEREAREAPPVREMKSVIPVQPTPMWAEKAALRGGKLVPYDEARIHEIEQQTFGRKLTHADYIALTGALPGATITVMEDAGGQLGHAGSSGLIVEVSHPRYTQMRSIGLDMDGKRHMHNDSFELRNRDDRNQGIGTRVFARQVDGAHHLGIDMMSTNGAGSSGSANNGYYTWARLGWNGPIGAYNSTRLRDSAPTEGLRRLAMRSGEVTTHQIFDTPGGAQWWRENGSSTHYEFDPAPGSEHRQRLDDYLEYKQIDPFEW